MTKTLADLMAKASTLESKIAARVEGAARDLTRSAARQPLEVVHAVLDHVEREIQPAGRGRRVFPFNQVRVLIAAPTPRDRAGFDAVCEGPPSLEARVGERLRTAGCELPRLAVTLSFVHKARPDWGQPDFDVECSRSAATAAVPPRTEQLELTITRGTTDQSVYTPSDPVMTLGRGHEVRDSRQRLLRTNHIAFTEGDDPINQSVSRRHARIERDAATGAFRLFDDGSTQGTSVMRGGRGLPAPRGARGLRLESGDEIALGQARVRVRITADTAN